MQSLQSSATWLAMVGPLVVAVYVNYFTPSTMSISQLWFHYHETSQLMIPFENVENDDDDDDEDDEDRDSDAISSVLTSIDHDYLCFDHTGTYSSIDTTWFGVLQEVDTDLTEIEQRATMNLICSSNKYMLEQLKLDENVTDYCRNHHESCSAWAAMGECIANPEFMQEKCAPACQCCDQLQFEARCPPRPLEWKERDVWRPGDMDDFFLQLATNETLVQKYHPVFHRHPARYNVGKNSMGPPTTATTNNDVDKDAPWIVTLPNFLSAHECTLLIELASKQVRTRTTKVGKVGKDGLVERVEGERRTSTSAWCMDACSTNETMQATFGKIESLVGIPQVNSEKMHFLRYLSGQQHELHRDFLPFEISRESGPRILTVLIYLNTVPLSSGGGTHFPMLNVTIQPTQGTALIFPVVLSHDLNRADDRTEHEALLFDPSEQQLSHNNSMVFDDGGPTQNRLPYRGEWTRCLTLAPFIYKYSILFYIYVCTYLLTPFPHYCLQTSILQYPSS
jgi:hypothetical protein